MSTIFLFETYRKCIFSLLQTGQYEKSKKYSKLHQQFVSTMMDVFYNSTAGVWFDIDLDTRKHNVNFFPSSFVPLYTGCYKFKDNTTVQKSLEYLKVNTFLIHFSPKDISIFMLFFQKSGALNYPGGVPTSLVNTSQQWDFPNGWPPLMHMIIEGFRKTGDTDLENEAFHLASIWLNNNYLLYNDTSYMFEKVSVRIVFIFVSQMYQKIFGSVTFWSECNRKSTCFEMKLLSFLFTVRRDRNIDRWQRG